MQTRSTSKISSCLKAAKKPMIVISGAVLFAALGLLIEAGFDEFDRASFEDDQKNGKLLLPILLGIVGAMLFHGRFNRNTSENDVADQETHQSHYEEIALENLLPASGQPLADADQKERFEANLELYQDNNIEDGRQKSRCCPSWR